MDNVARRGLGVSGDTTAPPRVVKRHSGALRFLLPGALCCCFMIRRLKDGSGGALPPASGCHDRVAGDIARSCQEKAVHCFERAASDRLGEKLGKATFEAFPSCNEASAATCNEKESTSFALRPGWPLFVSRGAAHNSLWLLTLWLLTTAPGRFRDRGLGAMREEAMTCRCSAAHGPLRTAS
eukprot:scaffold3319_cov258-Pinguiococcus_pyrenoidosus.AAC.15